MDTIFALSSGGLPSGVAVIRLSGPHVKNILLQFIGRIPKPRYMTFSCFRAFSGEILDKGLVVYFPSPNSFTGEDCAEFHLHGGKAVVSRFLDEVGRFSGCRFAEPGEFSRRAFSEGKFDLTEAEGLADLISAETESQRRLAFLGAGGVLSSLYRGWRERLIRSRAMIEAELDFSDEGDIPDALSDFVWEDIRLLKTEIDQHILFGKSTSVMRDGLKIVIAGVPNSGKSSVINCLAGRDVSIISEEAGTTRDALEVRIVISDLPVLVTDTAGLRETENSIEKKGINIALSRIRDADLVLVLHDMYNFSKIDLPETTATIWHIGNKLDLVSTKIDKEQQYSICFSVRTGEGWDNFIDKLRDFCQEKAGIAGQVIPARGRHISLLKACYSSLEQALETIGLDLVLRAEHLRRASDYLGRITGDINVEDLLDVIFSDFCIGK